MNISLAPALPAAAPTSPGTDADAGDTEAAAFAGCLEAACETVSSAKPGKAKPTAKGQALQAKGGDAGTTPAAPKLAPMPVPDDAAVAIDAALPAPEPSADAAEPDAAPPDLQALLPGWTPPAGAAPAISPPAAEPTAKGLEAALATDAPRSSTAQRVLQAVAHDTPPADAARADAAPALAAGPQAEAPTPREAPDAARRPLPDLASRTSDAVPATVLTPPAPMTNHAAGGANPSMPSAPIAPAPQHPDFAPALATQVRWWADAGVQQAQLTLNPPEMGPVTVRIVVNDAREARIDFSADLAATRAAIEGSLPVLAAALDESGLKLSGGGVHDGSRERHDAWQHARAQAGKHAAASHEPGANARTPVRAAATRGIVDLVA